MNPINTYEGRFVVNIFIIKTIIQPGQYAFEEKQKPEPMKMRIENAEKYFQLIDSSISGNKLYLDPDLSLHDVAKTVKLSERLVSRAIKQHKALNFTKYINLKRISHAKEIMQDPEQANKTILEILYESGFNSKSVFNVQFKKHTGHTPKKFRNTIQILDKSA